MGVIEYGLAIGNVAVFIKEPYSDKGMLEWTCLNKLVRE